MPRRVGILGVQHESNTFLPRRTTIDDFQQDTLLAGPAILERYTDSHHEVGGFIHGLRETGNIVSPIFLAMATPGGLIDTPTLTELLISLEHRLDQAEQLDGLLVAMHGAAAAAEDVDNVDELILRQVREHFPEAPLVATLDPHANVSQELVGYCDALIAYRTNPHMDQFDTGLAAARLLDRTMRGEVRPTTVLAKPGVAISIDRQHTGSEPCLTLYDKADEMLGMPGVLSNSVLLGFPYADVKKLGSGFLVVTDGDFELANRLACELAEHLRDYRQAFASDLPSVEEAVAMAANATPPVCLLDVGDNVGGGSPGDGTALARALIKEPIDPAFVCLYDPEAVHAAAGAGVNNPITLVMGGKTDRMHGEPITQRVTVDAIYEGRFTEPAPRHGGRLEYDMGQTARVSTPQGMTFLLTSHRVPPFSLRQLTCFGVRPESFQAIVAKGVNAPIAAYQEVCNTFIRVNTPGITCADMRQLPYRKRPKPLFPFEDTGL